MSKLTELLDELDLYDFAAEGIGPLAETTIYGKLRALAADMDRVLDSLDSPKPPTVPPTAPKRPAMILSEVDINPPNGGEPIIIGWDTCGRCHMHIRRCECADGPEEPRYVKSWRPSTPVGSKPAPTPKPDEAQAGSDLRNQVFAGLAAQRAKGGGGIGTPICIGCHKDVSSANADRNDDGTWTCHSCQGGTE